MQFVFGNNLYSRSEVSDWEYKMFSILNLLSIEPKLSWIISIKQNSQSDRNNLPNF